MNNNNKVKVSIIIPCYNQGKYIKDAIGSILDSTYKNIEIIVVDDGSTKDVDLIDNFSNPKIKIIHQKKQGVCAARNNGIREAAGDYILPLDADDKIYPTYIEKAMNVFKNNPKISIVYCRAEYFGTTSGEWTLPEFKFPDCLWENAIFNSAVYKKSDWAKVGGYKTQVKNGNEDWEFWISMIENGAEVYKIPEILFSYRCAENYMSNKMKLAGNEIDRIKELMRLHPNLYIDNLEKIIFPLNKILSIDVPKEQIKSMYSFRLKTKLWKKKMLYVLVGKE